jgi:hypothetical protein
VRVCVYVYVCVHDHVCASARVRFSLCITCIMLINVSPEEKINRSLRFLIILIPQFNTHHA